jgi:2-polyprenyl-3-methyl-5-hydroxy-6-metoxy-1,4-benzoquinol methylase
MDRDAWNERYAGTDLLWSAEPNRFLVAELSGLTPGTALDVACGEGRNAVWLAERGWKVTGIDFSDVAITKAQRLAAARGVTVTWVVADVTEHDIVPHSYDLVVVMYLQLPEPERGSSFERAAAAVAPGGTLLVVGHDRTNLTDGWGGPRDERVLYGPDDVAGAIGPELTIVRAERVRRPVATEEGEKQAVDALVRAVRSA